jgi:hypothetical protein
MCEKGRKMPGGRVYHPKYGYGTVRRGRNKGFELEVAFDSGLIRWIALNELVEAQEYAEKFRISLSFLPSSRECPKSRRMIEAFRLGIVPYDSVRDFTFGRDDEKTQAQKWLDSEDDNVLIVIGEYGAGKTHFLQYVLGWALQEGFATAWVSMDPLEVPFSKPKRVYSHLIRNFRFRSPENGQLARFREFLRLAIAQGAFRDHVYFQHLVGKTSDEDLWNWIEAREARCKPAGKTIWDYRYLPGLYDYGNAANIYCYLLSSLGWAAKRIMGLRGLLIAFDEAETIDTYTYPYRLKNGLNFLRALIHTANNSLDEAPDLSCYSEKPDFLYREPSGLKIVFAFTCFNSVVSELDDVPKIDLEPLGDDALKEAFEHICHLYSDAYNCPEARLSKDDIFRRMVARKNHLRLFVKGSVEALDLVRFHPEKSLDEILR